MVSEQRILTDNSLVSRLDSCLLRLEMFFALLSGLAVFGLVLLAVVSVSGRNFFNAPLQGYVDWIEQAMPLIAFMGIALVQRNGGHIRMDMWIGTLKGRTFYGVEFVTTLMILVLMILLTWGSFSHFSRSIDFSAPMFSRDSSIDIALPLWPAKMIVPLVFSTVCLRLALQLWGYGRLWINPRQVPVSIPLVINAVTQARQEAESLEKSG